MAASRCCCRCGLSEDVRPNLELTTLCTGGQLVEVCKVCYLVSEIGTLAARIACPSTRLVVQEGLEQLYLVARAQLENAAESQGESQG